VKSSKLKSSKLFLALAATAVAVVQPAVAEDVQQENLFAPAVVTTAELQIEAQPANPNFLVVAYDSKESGPPKEPRKPMLTEDQMKKMRTLHDQHRIDTAQKQAQLMALKHKMGDLMGEANIDRNQVTSLHGKITALQNDLSESRLKLMLDSAEILTPEQRSKMHNRMMRGPGPMGGPGFGGPGFGGPGFPPPPGMPPPMVMGLGDDDGFPPPFFAPFGQPPFQVMVPGVPVGHHFKMRGPHPGGPCPGGGGPCGEKDGPPSDDK